MPYYKKWVCVELYVPIAVEAENEYQAKQEVINRITGKDSLSNTTKRKIVSVASKHSLKTRTSLKSLKKNTRASRQNCKPRR